MTAEYFKDLFKAKATNAYHCVIPNNQSRKKRYQFYRNKDLNRMSKESFDNGQIIFHAKCIKAEDPRFADKYEYDDPHYVYHLKRDLTEEEYNALIALLQREEGS